MEECSADTLNNTPYGDNIHSYELAVIPGHSEMQLVALPGGCTGNQFPPSPSSSCPPQNMSSVCPTCNRPLNKSDMDNVTSKLTVQQFTPQYFRELEGVKQQCLSICENPSFFLQEKESVDILHGESKPNLFYNKKREKTEQQMCVENEEDIPYDRKEEEEGGEGSCAGGHYSGYYVRYFRELQKLGSGSYGGVYLCQHVMEGVSLGYFAVKKVPVGDNIEYLQKVLSEVRILEEVKRHPNVVEYHHSWVDIAKTADFGPRLRCLFILMEYANMGSVASFLEHYSYPLSTVGVWYLFLGALAGTAHLHRKNIIHRDLKPQNLLLAGERDKLPRVLVSDFGTAALLGEVSYERTGNTGTMHYIAPELSICAPEDKNKYIYQHTKASDVWSLGVTLHYLAFNRTLPIYSSGGDVVLNTEECTSCRRPPEMLELIRAMLRANPTERPTCDELLKSTVVQTIIRGLKRAKTFSDMFLLGAGPVSMSKVEEMEESRLSQDTMRKGVIISPLEKKNSFVSTEEIGACVQSPLAEVPLILQYKMLEGSVKSPAGTLSLSKFQTRRTVDQAVQTDYVKIVYD